MRPKDVRTVLSSMAVLVDSREQDTDRARWRYASIGLPVERCVLDYGDYSYNATLPNGQRIYDTSEKAIAYRDFNSGHGTLAAHAFNYCILTGEDDYADLCLLKVHGNARGTGRECYELIRHAVTESGNGCDAVAYGVDQTDLVDQVERVKCLIYTLVEFVVIKLPEFRVIKARN